MEERLESKATVQLLVEQLVRVCKVIKRSYRLESESVGLVTSGNRFYSKRRLCTPYVWNGARYLIIDWCLGFT